MAIDEFLELKQRQVEALERIASSLELLAPQPKASNYKHALEEFAAFDWGTIGATVEQRDKYGVAVVNWKGNRYIRRSPENSYGVVIFFSRCTGKDEEGRNCYERLITFAPTKDFKIRPVSREVEEILR